MKQALKRSLGVDAIWAFADLLTRDGRLYKAATVLVEEGGLLRQHIGEIEETEKRSAWINVTERDRLKQYRKRLKDMCVAFADEVKAIKQEAYATAI